MKKAVLLLSLSFVMATGACAKKEPSTFEDVGKKMDNGIHNAGENIDKNLNKAGENVKDATH